MQVRTNMDNTVTQIKRLLGRKFSEPGVQEEMKEHLNFQIVEQKDDDIGIEVCRPRSAKSMRSNNVSTPIISNTRTHHPPFVHPCLLVRCR